MRTKLLLTAAALAAVGLSACERSDGPRAVAGICPDWKAAPTATDPAAPVDNCVKRWAYTLAGTRDDADLVADAVVSACEAQLGRWNQANLGQPPADGAEAISITTGQPTNPLAEHYNFAQSRAVLYVMQARAGRCAAPPVKDGVPTGIAP
jgi:hypothetical protein